MGAIGGLLGLNGGFNGTGAAAPTGTTINPGTDIGQLGNSYVGAQAGLNDQRSALAGQQQLLQALQAQNGLGNQSQVFNQLQGVANGTGPNPAAAQLAQATSANTQNQAAMQAGQRGAGANVGLMARNAGTIGAQNQQNSALGAANLQAQQSLGALGQMGGIAGQQAGQQIGAQGAVTGAAQGLSAGAQGEQNILQNANAAANQANVGMQSNVNNANAGLAQSTMGGLTGILGGALGGGGVAASMLGGSGGSGASIPSQAGGSAGLQLGTGMKQGSPSLFGAEGGMVPGGLMSTPGAFLAAQQQGNVQPFASGGPVKQNLGDLLKDRGGKVPGTPKVKGNSIKNDTVKALVSPGEVVIPNSVMQAKDPVRGAAEFVRAVLAKKGRTA